MQNIPVVGGTKDIAWDRVLAQQPDLLVMDREENTRGMAENSPIPVLATHVLSTTTCAEGLANLADRLDSPVLWNLVGRWRRVEYKLNTRTERARVEEILIPGLVDWVRRPTHPITDVLYLVWYRPWMTVSAATFIGSVMDAVGLGELNRNALTRHGAWDAPPAQSRYPTVELDRFDPDRTLLLFSTEPFPFHRKRSLVEPLPFPSAIVDGEAYSWFGVRTLAFLEQHLGLSPSV